MINSTVMERSKVLEIHYIGNWKYGDFLGEGKLTTPNGVINEGNWKEGTQEGLGTRICPNGVTYTGEFLNNKIPGIGIYSHLVMVENHIGEFRDHLPHGEGAQYSAEGDITYEGLWIKANLVGDLSNRPAFISSSQSPVYLEELSKEA